MTARTPLRVLYVEDDHVCVLLMAQVMAGEPGIDLVIVEDGAEALAAVAGGWTPELLVLDAHLPDTSGHALLARLRALPGRSQVPPACARPTPWPRTINAPPTPASITAGRNRCRCHSYTPACVP